MLGCTLATNVLVDRNDVVAVTLTVVGQGKGLRTGGRSRDLYGVIARPSKLERSSSGVMTPNRMHPPTALRGRVCPHRCERYRLHEFGHRVAAVRVCQERHIEDAVVAAELRCIGRVRSDTGKGSANRPEGGAYWTPPPVGRCCRVTFLDTWPERPARLIPAVRFRPPREGDREAVLGRVT